MSNEETDMTFKEGTTVLYRNAGHQSPSEPGRTETLTAPLRVTFLRTHCFQKQDMASMMMQQDPTYTERCSSVTLQSNKRGFFFDFANNVAETVGSAWIDGTFAGLRTDEERLKACHELGDCVHGVLQNVQELYRQKSGSLSAQKRQEAERYLGAGDPRHALQLCNHAVTRAPPTGRRQQWRWY